MLRNPIRLALVGLVFSSASALAQVQAGATFSGDGLRSFYFAIGNYYNVPQTEVTLVRERQLPPDEIPVVCYLAKRARVQPVVVVDLRQRGLSWVDIAARYRLEPDIYFFRGGPPYGKAHGYWKKHPPRDVEIIESVNVHFLSDYHHVSPDVIVTEKSRQGSYAVVAVDFEAKSGKHRGKGKGKGHDR